MNEEAFYFEMEAFVRVTRSYPRGVVGAAMTRLCEIGLERRPTRDDALDIGDAAVAACFCGYVDALAPAEVCRDA